MFAGRQRAHGVRRNNHDVVVVNVNRIATAGVANNVAIVASSFQIVNAVYKDNRLVSLEVILFGKVCLPNDCARLLVSNRGRLQQVR